MSSARRPKFLQHMDEVQGCIEEHPGLTLKQLATRTKLSYAQVQEACMLLHNRGYVTRKRGSALTFHPNS
jgi:DNA-binding IclR family transcriptional regulator